MPPPVSYTHLPEKHPLLSKRGRHEKGAARPFQTPKGKSKWKTASRFAKRIFLTSPIYGFAEGVTLSLIHISDANIADLDDDIREIGVEEQADDGGDDVVYQRVDDRGDVYKRQPEPFFVKNRVRVRTVWWTVQDSNL